MAGRSVSIWLRVNPATDEQHNLREYRLHIPDGYTPTTSTPLVLYFHGAGGTAAQADRDSGWSSLADRDHFLVAYPQGLPFVAGAPPAWASAGPIDPKHTATAADMMLTRANQLMRASFRCGRRR